MSMFDYKNYSSTESAQLLQRTYELATEALPSTWRELTPAELGLPKNAVDADGYYIITSPLTGTTPGGEQAKLLGEYNAAGQLTSVCINYIGTNSLVDLPDYFQLNSGELAPKLDPLLTSLKNFAVQNGLTAKDCTVTGYSLGGALANMTAEYRETLADGFYKEANFIAFESPLIYNDPSIVFNYGYENDVVYRAIGDKEHVTEVIAAVGPLLINQDWQYDSTMDNTVLFNDMYASPLWATPFSILSLIVGWDAHGGSTTAISRVTSNPFYSLMEKDSTTIIADLSWWKRGTTWVEDRKTHTSDHYGTASFIIGSMYDDLLKGGKGNDYIFGDTGNDKIQTGAGVDRVDGGTGANTLQVTGTAADWSTYRLSDGTVFLAANKGGDLKQAENVQHVTFEGNIFNANHTYEIGAKALMDKSNFMFGWFNKNINHQTATEGTAGNDNLTGTVVFGQDGNDIINAKIGVASLLHGGEGNDVLKGSTLNDELYGAEGNDILYGTKGSDVLYGGVGDDNFLFNLFGGTTQIMDFNVHEGDIDTISFSSSLFADYRSIIGSTRQVGDDVLIQTGTTSISIYSANVLDVLQNVYVI